MKASVGGKQAVGDEHVEMGMEDKVVAEGVNGGNGAELAFGDIE